MGAFRIQSLHPLDSALNRVKPTHPVKTLTLDGTSLTLEDLAPLARGEDLTLRITRQARAAVKHSRTLVDEILRQGTVVYGISTGFGKLKSQAIAPGDLAELQSNLVLSHCVGVGEPMPLPEVRIAQVLRLNSLLRGYSGVRLSLVEDLLRLFNAGFVPEVPQQGSVGASGDLAPLSHMAAAYMGHGYAFVQGKRRKARGALKALGMKPLTYAAKEGLALINGTEIMKATGVVNVLAAKNLSCAADAVASLTIEALLGSDNPFQPVLAEIKDNDGHRRTAANIRRCLSGSRVLESHLDCDRVQDPYSLRCIPQIHGAFKTALEHVEQTLCSELNVITDNPIIDPQSGQVYSAGMFHGQPLSMIQDYLGLALATMANVSERRIEQLVNPDLSHLPAFLATQPGLHSGLMIAQYTAASLASENKVLAHPASADSIPTSANQEDHVSMGVTAARKARTILGNVEQVVAIEWICAAQAREFNASVRAGKGAQAAYGFLRKHIAPLDADRYLHTDLVEARDLLKNGSLVHAVRRAVRTLEA